MAGLHKIDPDVEDEDVLLLFSTDLSGESKNEKGFVVMEKTVLSVYTDGQVNRIPISEISEIRYTADFGCITIECVRNEKDVILCRATMAKLHEVSVICKQMNRHIEGRPIELREDKNLENVCPKCGRPYKNRNRICTHCTNFRGNFVWLWNVAKPEWLKILLATVMILANALVSILTPKINANMVDNYIKSSDPAAITWQSFALVVLALAGAEIASRVFTMIRNSATAYTGNNISKSLRKTVFEKIESLSFGKVSKKQTGELMERINSDTENIRQQITGMIPELVYQFFIIIAVTVIIFRFDWRLGLLIFVPIPFVFLGFYSFWGITRRNYHKQWTKNSKVSTILHDIFNGIRVVKSFGMERKEAERFDRSAKEVSDISIKNNVFFSIIAPLLNFAIGIGEFFLLYYAGKRILNGEMTLGVMTKFSAYVSLIYGRMRWFANIPRRLVSFITSLTKICELLREEPDICDKENSDVTDITGNISFDHVNFGYEDANDVLKDITFDVHKGEMIGLVGKSGTGKSTLINLLMRLYEVDDGAIRIDGTDIRDIPQEVLRRNIGVVLQENYLFRGTIFQNIAYAKPDATRDEVVAAAKVSGAHSFIMKLPDGYDTYIGEHGQTLSGGEKQRISIARAMLHNPKILILDEATASLDTETEHDIQEALKKLTEDRTTIAIAHRLSTLRNATRLVVLNKGRIAEIGTHEELLQKKGIYYGLVMAQRQMSKMSEVNNGKCFG